MLTTIVVNLPVRRLEASADFFNQLGFTVDTALSGASATHVVIGEHVSLMLVAESFFRTITARDVVDPATGAEVVIQLQLDSRAQVDRLVDAALGAGGQVANPPNDQGHLYGRSFRDLDGHLWDAFHADVAAAGGARVAR